MISRKAFPWAAIVLGTSGTAVAQATVADDPRAHPGPNIRAAARDRRSISLSTEPVDVGDDVPEFHTVQRGDTLWDLTGYYFQNPWRWPGVWGLNPQITNPHWIFPGDQVRLLQAGTVTTAPLRPAVTSAGGLQTPPERTRVAPHTIFLRQEGWLERDDTSTVGSIVGSPDDRTILTEGDQAYVAFPQRTPRIGEQYTVFQDGQAARGGHGGGHVVRVIGAVAIETWDPDRHMATVRITESIDGIERGERVAAIPRQLEVVPPTANSVDLTAAIVGTIQPREVVGQNMVIFLDRGRADHVAAGNRLFVVRRGDGVERTLPTTGASISTGIDRDGDGNVDNPPGPPASPDRLPEETVGEVLVVEVREHTATALVTSSITDLEVGDRLLMRRGY